MDIQIEDHAVVVVAVVVAASYYGRVVAAEAWGSRSCLCDDFDVVAFVLEESHYSPS